MLPIPKPKFGKRLRYTSLMVNETILGLMKFPFSCALFSGPDVREPYHLRHFLSNGAARTNLT